MSGNAMIMYETSSDGITLRAALAGELDLADADEVRDNLAAAAQVSQCRFLQVDVSNITFIDSYAIGALVSARNTAAAAGVTLTLINPSPPVGKAIQVTGLSAVFGLSGWTAEPLEEGPAARADRLDGTAAARPTLSDG